jgi:uncharacterized protein
MEAARDGYATEASQPTSAIDSGEAGHRPPRGTPAQAPEQHPLWWSVVLHLTPGMALTAFVIAVHAAFGMEPLLALLMGIVLVIAPLELGYLSVYARRTTGSWSPLGAVDYRTKLPWKRLTATAVGLAVWMLMLVGVSMVLLDEWLATTVFTWIPDAIGTMATVGADGEPMSTGALVAFLALFLLANGVVGPITEELYFRGHLLPRLERYGRGAPVINTALFTVYHFHTPWRYPVVFLGYLPICVATWRRRSMWIGLAAHLIINNVFVLMMLATYLAA